MALTIADAVDERRIPQRTKDALHAYIREARHPGGFLVALLQNNLREAVVAADDENIHAIPAIVAWLRTNAPFYSWGSRFLVSAWLAKQDVSQASCVNPCSHCLETEDD